jgi:2-amino-4-hydroxy-6-hydroxymethyldihydropteridine diphosphokinase
MHRVFLSLGTNLGNRMENIHFCLKRIEEQDGTIEAESSVYETEPWGYTNGGPFLNMVIRISTNLTPMDLLDVVKNIEKEMGRNIKATFPYEARIIDIDILFYDNLIVEEKYLTIPQKLIEERLFDLVPLEEMAPDFIHPVLKCSICQLRKNCTDKSIVKQYTA